MLHFLRLDRAPLDRKDWLTLTVGLLALIKVRVLGTFALSEILLLVCYLCLGTRFMAFKRDKLARGFMLMTVVWLAGVVLSDLWNDTSTENFLKGTFNVVLLIAQIPPVFWLLRDKPARVLYYYAGLALSSLFNFYFQRADTLDEVGADVWGMYAYVPLFVFALPGWLYYKGHRLLACAVAEGFAFYSLFHASRNTFLNVTLAVAIILYVGKINEQNVARQIKRIKKHAAGLLLLLAAAFFFVTTVYTHLASNGTLGEAAYEKYVMQSSDKRGLASGRGDFFEAFYMATKHPVFGYGSYAVDKDLILLEYFQQEGILPDDYDRYELLPGHSHLMGGWLYAGILGLFFWLYVLKRIGLFAKIGLLRHPRLIGISTIATALTLWNIFFSPFGNRPNFLFFMTLILVLTSSAQQTTKYENRPNKV